MLDLLKGIRVISFNDFLFGPMGVQALADLGADVIAVEAPEGAWQRHWSGGEESGSLANELNAKQDTKQPGI